MPPARHPYEKALSEGCSRETTLYGTRIDMCTRRDRAMLAEAAQDGPLRRHRENCGAREPDGAVVLAWLPRRRATTRRRSRFERLGVAHSEIKPSVVGDLSAFRDPDNIQLEVYAPYPDQPLRRVGGMPLA